MAKAKIYRPAKNAMQSGKANSVKWMMEYKPTSPKIVDNLMGWQGSTDMLQEVKLKFDSRDSAIAYAKHNGIDFEVIEPKDAKLKIKSYAENFTG
jgi:predicted DNA-binding transcriptional regulator YafY